MTTTKPPKTITRTLRKRLTTGFSRLLRGTAQAVLRTFCAAWPSPSTPYRATRRPMVIDQALP